MLDICRMDIELMELSLRILEHMSAIASRTALSGANAHTERNLKLVNHIDIALLLLTFFRIYSKDTF